VQAGRDKHVEAVLDRVRGQVTPENRAPLASAFASTFVWALAMIVIALIPAVGMALGGWRARARRSVVDHELVAGSTP
jgi:hypothetical protein